MKLNYYLFKEVVEPTGELEWEWILDTDEPSKYGPDTEVKEEEIKVTVSIDDAYFKKIFTDAFFEADLGDAIAAVALKKTNLWEIRRKKVK